MSEFNDFFNDRSFTFQYTQGTYINRPLPQSFRRDYMLVVIYAPRPLPIWLNDPLTREIGVQILHMKLTPVPHAKGEPDLQFDLDGFSRVFARDRDDRLTYRDARTPNALKFISDGNVIGLGPVHEKALRKAYGKYVIKTVEAPLDNSAAYHGDMDFAVRTYSEKIIRGDLMHRGFRQESYKGHPGP